MLSTVLLPFFGADFAQPSSGVQLLRAPLVQAEAGPGGLLPFNSRRRRITGMAASSDGDLLVATKQVLIRWWGPVHSNCGGEGRPLQLWQVRRGQVLR